MKRQLALCVLMAGAGLLMATHAAAEVQWTSIKDDRFHFALELPCAARPEDSPPSEGTAGSRAYSCPSGSAKGEVFVSIIELDPRIPQEKPDDVRAGMRALADSFRKKFGKAVDSIDVIDRDGTPGVELGFHDASGPGHFRAFANGPRIYMIVSGGLTPDEDARLLRSLNFNL